MAAPTKDAHIKRVRILAYSRTGSAFGSGTTSLVLHFKIRVDDIVLAAVILV